LPSASSATSPVRSETPYGLFYPVATPFFPYTFPPVNGHPQGVITAANPGWQFSCWRRE
jgi:hypothetical protein